MENTGNRKNRPRGHRKGLHPIISCSHNEEEVKDFFHVSANLLIYYWSLARCPERPLPPPHSSLDPAEGPGKMVPPIPFQFLNNSLDPSQRCARKWWLIATKSMVRLPLSFTTQTHLQLISLTSYESCGQIWQNYDAQMVDSEHTLLHPNVPDQRVRYAITSAQTLNQWYFTGNTFCNNIFINLIDSISSPYLNVWRFHLAVVTLPLVTTRGTAA